MDVCYNAHQFDFEKANMGMAPDNAVKAVKLLLFLKGNPLVQRGNYIFFKKTKLKHNIHPVSN